MSAVKLVNESALGIYVFSWQASGKRCELSWYEGLANPAFSFYVSSLGRMSPPVAVRSPGRFASWPLPAGKGKQLSGFKAFALAFALAAEQDS
jgi:hypothetical protein